MNRLAVLVGLLVVVGTAGTVVAATTAVSLDGDDLSLVDELRHGTDPLDADTDEDGLDDSTEVAAGADPSDADTDGDGLRDGAEVTNHGTDPLGPDTDGDGLDDGREIRETETEPNDADTDDDDLADGAEVDTHGTDPTGTDSDGDGLADGVEVHDHRSDPTDADSDDDGLGDRREVVELGTDPTAADTDDDGLSDRREVEALPTDPLVADTDGDGLADGREVTAADTDPVDPDSDGDGLEDGREVDEFGSEPLEADTDGDGLADGIEAATDGPLADADPARMDVFVELDYMADERPDDRAIELVQAAYADAPVENPDGTTGIELHVVVDDRVPREETTHPQDVPRLMGANFDRTGYGYHYAIAVDDARRLGADVGGYAAFGVIAFQTGSPQDAEPEDAYPVRSQAQLFMHELGHSAGLLAGDFAGIDSVVYPHEAYPSAMNYNAQSGFVDYNSGEPFDDWQHLVDNLHTPGTNNAEPPP